MDTSQRAKHERTRQAIASEVRARRAYVRMSQTDLVRATGLSRSTVSRIENGERDMDVPQLIAICAALQTTPADLLKSAMSAAEQTA